MKCDAVLFALITQPSEELKQMPGCLVTPGAVVGVGPYTISIFPLVYR